VNARVLILTDNSGAADNGASHVSDLIAAFTATGASVTTNTTELTNNSAMALSLVTGWDVVIVVTVTGQPIDAADVSTLQTAVNTRASDAFMFFTDACQGCTVASAQSMLPIVNGVTGSWTAGLGLADNSSFSAIMNSAGPYSVAFANQPSIQSAAYSPLTGVPSANVLYTSNAPIHPGPMAVIAPRIATPACVFMTTDVTEFWVTGGIPLPQANALARDYLNTAMSAPCKVASPRVLILTDNSAASGNGASHVSDLIAAFAGTGAAVTTNTSELTNNSAMALSLVTGWDVVIVVTVSGQPIDAADVATLQTAVDTRASGAFMFFTDACQGCTIASAQSILPIVNHIAGWSAGLGPADNSTFAAALNSAGPHNTEFANLPSIQGTAYSPMTGVPALYVLYTANAPNHPGPMAAIAPGTDTSACVFMATDVTPFWVTGGISPAQASGLAQDYMNTVMSCPCTRANQITVGVAQLQEKDHQFSLLIDNNPLIRGVARMRFVLDRRGLVDLRIYDVGGRFIAPLATGSYEAGEHLVTWNATDRSGRAVPSGIYSVRIRVAGEIQSKAIVVIR
jgi:hypothetical protein